MKKFLALFMVCAMALTLSAKTSSTLLFSRPQFQPHKATAATPTVLLTVPLIYKGSMTFKGWAADNDDERRIDIGMDYCVDDTKGTMPAFMTICQPCIDCFPCEVLPIEPTEPGVAAERDEDGYGPAAEVAPITRWNLYLVDVDKKAKTALVYKINLLNEDAAAAFFTGPIKKNAYMQYLGYAASIVLVGKKNDYKFKYLDAIVVKNEDDDGYTWAATGTGKLTAYIKSATKLDGLVCFANIDLTEDAERGYQFCGTMKLSRNASLTKKAITATFSSVTETQGKNWADCAIVTQADVCEAFFQIADNGIDAFDDYLVEKEYKKYEVDFIYDGTIDEIFETIIFGEEYIYEEPEVSNK